MSEINPLPLSEEVRHHCRLLEDVRHNLGFINSGGQYNAPEFRGITSSGSKFI
jgi:hypothetical protein